MQNMQNNMQNMSFQENMMYVSRIMRNMFKICKILVCKICKPKKICRKCTPHCADDIWAAPGCLPVTRISVIKTPISAKLENPISETCTALILSTRSVNTIRYFWRSGTVKVACYQPFWRFLTRHGLGRGGILENLKTEATRLKSRLPD